VIRTSWEGKEGKLSQQLASVRGGGFAGVVFGHLHLADGRGWDETRVTRAGLEHLGTIWGEPPQALLDEFVSSGGRAVLTCVELAKLDESWLGRVTDDTFASQIGDTGADPCGENGEYHSFAFAGPVFTRPVTWMAGGGWLDAGWAHLALSGGTWPLRASRRTADPPRASR